LVEVKPQLIYLLAKVSKKVSEEDLTAEGAEGAEGGGKKGRLPRIAIGFVLRVLVFCTVEF